MEKQNYEQVYCYVIVYHTFYYVFTRIYFTVFYNIIIYKLSCLTYAFVNNNNKKTLLGPVFCINRHGTRHCVRLLQLQLPFYTLKNCNTRITTNTKRFTVLDAVVTLYSAMFYLV